MLQTRKATPYLLGLAALLLALVPPAVPLGAADPVTFNVDSNADAGLANPAGKTCVATNGKCTLRAAVQAANNNQPTDAASITIVVPEGTFELSPPPPAGNGELLFKTNVVVIVSGAGAGKTIIDGKSVTRVIDVCQTAGIISQVRINSLTIRNGIGTTSTCQAHRHGGAIHNHGDLRLIGVSVENSQALSPAWEEGGGIFNATDTLPPILDLRHTTIKGNTAARGGGSS